MSIQEAKQIIAEYGKHDSAFRSEKKKGDFKRASISKAKRDALQDKLTQAFKVEKEDSGK